MDNDHKDDPATYPALGRFFTWVDRPGNPTKLFRALIVVCVLAVLADFTYKPLANRISPVNMTKP